MNMISLNNSGVYDGRVDQNDSGKSGLRSQNDMSHSVCLFRKYLHARRDHQHKIIGKTNIQESEVFNNNNSPPKFIPTSLLRPPSRLERRLIPELRCSGVVKSSVSFAEKPSNTSQQQLTLFYDGEVNVYDNVSVEKAQKIMLILDGDVREASKTKGIHSLRKSKPGPQLARKYSIQSFIEKRRHRMISHYTYDRGVAASRPMNNHTEEETITSKRHRPPQSLSQFPPRLGYFFPI